MPTDHLTVNLAALERAGTPAPPGAAEAGDPDTGPTGFRLVREDGTSVALNSARSADREAAGMLARAATGRAVPTVVALIGVGLGYLVDAVEATWPDAHIVALETEPACARAFLLRRDVSRTVGEGRLTLLWAPDYRGAARVQALFGDRAGRLPLVLHHPVLARERPAETARARKLVQRLVASHHEAVLLPHGAANVTDAEPAERFTRVADLYLASADRIDFVLRNCDDLRRRGLRPDTYATVVGGLSGLNYLAAIEAPRRIVFFDVNPAALAYAGMIREVIAISETPADFVGRLFSRRVSHFLVATGASDLTADNQSAFLALPPEEPLRHSTMAALSPGAREVYQRFVLPHQDGRVLDGVRNCRRLLPCWPVGRKVPVDVGGVCDFDGDGQLDVNTNSFFYGQGWLGSGEAFLRVKRALTEAEVTATAFDLLARQPAELVSLTAQVVVHVSNIDDWFPQAWAGCLWRWMAAARAAGGDLSVVTSHNGVVRLPTDPHDWAVRAVAPHVRGRVVEVTHTVPWGFHEFAPLNVEVEDYLGRAVEADTTILHILVGEGVPRATWARAMRKALATSPRTLVLEHNRDSRDWDAGRARRFLDEPELRQAVADCAPPGPALRVSVVEVPGDRDGKRNLLALVDRG